MHRLPAAFLILCAVSCAATARRPQAVAFAPLSPAAAAEASRRIEMLSAAIPVEAYEAHLFRASNGIALPYRLLRPREAAAKNALPLVVIFHGAGAIGEDNRAQIGPVAKGWATDEARRRFPAFVLIPQFPVRSANYTAGPDGLPRSEGTDRLAAAVELVHHIRATENVATEHTYAMGFSMGGSAIWNVLRQEPGLFARAAIVGGVPADGAARAIGKTRVLLVHGDADTENPFAAAWNVFQSSNGGIDFWRFRGLAHDFPLELITTDRLREWLFAAIRPSS